MICGRNSGSFVAICPGFEVKYVTVQHEDKEGFFFFLSAEVYFTERNLFWEIMCFVFKCILNESQGLFALLCMFMYTVQFSSYCAYFACKWGKFDLPAFLPSATPKQRVIQLCGIM